jgi:hypothetical protein
MVPSTCACIRSDHDVQLPDEYDHINQDLYIYRSLSPSRLRSAITHASTLPDTFTISVVSGRLRTRSTYSPDLSGAFERLDGQVSLLKDFGIDKWLEDVQVVFGIHDTPTGFIAWDLRRELMDRVEDRECACYETACAGRSSG